MCVCGGGRLSHPAPLGPRAQRPLRQHGGENKALGRPASAGGGCIRQSTGLVAEGGAGLCACVRAGAGLSWSVEPSPVPRGGRRGLERGMLLSVVGGGAGDGGLGGEEGTNLLARSWECW